jgi:polyisoprenoid-binding protein YceI
MMQLPIRLGSLVLLLASASLAQAAADPPPARIAEPAVPAEIAARGTVYHTISGRQAQVTFTSEASIQNIVGKSNAVVGYAVSGAADTPAQLAGARWLLPVASLATGIPLRDEHLAGEHWLDAARFPSIEFALDRVEDIAVAKSGADFTTFTATLVGRLTVHGVERELRVEKTTLSFLKGSERTATIAPGDLLFVQCSYSIRLSDFGIRNGDVPDKVADSIRLTQILRLTTAELEPEPLPSPAPVLAPSERR